MARQTQTLDFTTFNQAVRFRELLESMRALRKPTSQRHPLVKLLGFLFLAGMFVLFAGFLVALYQTSNSGQFLLFFLIIALLLTTSVVFACLAFYKNADRAVRLRRLADANKFTFSAMNPLTSQPGLIFSEGEDKQYTTVVSGTYHNLPFEFGNFYRTVGSGRSKRQQSFGVLSVRLTRKLPHILLDSRKNNGLGFSNFALFENSQQLTLEGNFNDYFELYVPNGYERDALYFITPELMALLIDFGADFDIEIVDDRLYIYKQKLFELQKQYVIEDIFELIDILGAEVQENTKRYADTNVGNRAANVVAEPGRRLKRPTAWLAIIAFIVTLVMIYALTAVVVLT